MLGSLQFVVYVVMSLETRKEKRKRKKGSWLNGVYGIRGEDFGKGEERYFYHRIHLFLGVINKRLEN